MDIVPEAGTWLKYQGFECPVLVANVTFCTNLFSGVISENGKWVKLSQLSFSRIERLMTADEASRLLYAICYPRPGKALDFSSDVGQKILQAAVDSLTD